MSAFRYVPYHRLGTNPNIIVDGSANEHTAMTLSHWPGNSTPDHLKADLSAEIVFNFIERGAGPEHVEAVSNNHFDEDGLVGLYSIINPEESIARKDFLIDIARAGDFSRCADRDAARVSFALSAWSDPVRSPLSASIFGGESEDLTMVLYEELLPRLTTIIEKIDHFAHLWKDDDRCLDLTEDAIASGRITIETDDALDLSVVAIPDEGVLGELGQPADPKSWVSSVCHPMAIHNTTDSTRILVIQQRRYELYFRYESWVEFVSRAVPPRVDLTPMASRLNSSQDRGRGWSFNGVDAIIARLTMRDGRESNLSPNQFTSLVREELAALAVGTS